MQLVQAIEKEEEGRGVRRILRMRRLIRPATCPAEKLVARLQPLAFYERLKTPYRSAIGIQYRLGQAGHH